MGGHQRRSSDDAGRGARAALRWVLAGLVVAGLGGCDAELRGDLSEAQADEIVLALDAASIAARKDRGRGPGRFRVSVARGEIASALAVLAERGLPREEASGLEALLEGGGLLESPEVERARYAAALGAELARSLESMPGVRRARVHLALGPPSGAPLDAPPAPARASVLLHVTPAAALDDDAARALVAGAVTGLAAGDVRVVRAPAAPARAAGPALAAVGPFAVRRADALGVKLAFAGSFALNLALVLLVFGLMRARRGRPAGAARPETRAPAALAPDEAAPDNP